MSGLGPTFMKIWTCGSSPRSGSRNAWTQNKNVNGDTRLSKFRNIFGAIEMISFSDCLPWTKPGYITMTRRQSSGGTAAHPVPKKIRVQKSPGKQLASILSDQDGILLIDYLPKGKQTQSITYLCWCNWGTFWGKNAAWTSPSGSWSFTTMPRFTGQLQHRRDFPTWASSVFITHPILRIWLHRTTTCSVDWRSIESRHFSSDAKLIVAAETWLEGQTADFYFLFFLWLAKFTPAGEKCIEFRGDYVE